MRLARLIVRLEERNVAVKKTRKRLFPLFSAISLVSAYYIQMRCVHGPCVGVCQTIALIVTPYCQENFTSYSEPKFFEHVPILETLPLLECLGPQPQPVSLFPTEFQHVVTVHYFSAVVRHLVMVLTVTSIFDKATTSFANHRIYSNKTHDQIQRKNFQEKELSHKYSALAFVRLCCCSCTIYQETLFWRTEGQELFASLFDLPRKKKCRVLNPS